MIKIVLAISLLALTGCTVAVGGSTVAAEGGYIIQAGNAQELGISELAQCLEVLESTDIGIQD